MGALPKPHCHWEQPGLWWAKKFVSPSYSFCMTPDYTKKNEVLLEHCHENLHPIYTKLAISRSWTKYIRGGVCSFAFFFPSFQWVFRIMLIKENINKIHIIRRLKLWQTVHHRHCYRSNTWYQWTTITTEGMKGPSRQTRLWQYRTMKDITTTLQQPHPRIVNSPIHTNILKV